jgi:hypothetical protein
LKPEPCFFVCLKVTNKEVLINICDQMHERCAKLLTQRSKLGAASLISTQELTSIGLLISIFAQETILLSGKHCTGEANLIETNASGSHLFFHA